MDLLNAAAVGDCEDVRHWPVWDPLVPHLSRVFGHCGGPDGLGPLARLLNEVGQLLMGKARYAEAEPLMRRSVAIVEGIEGPDHPEVAIRLHNLAAFLQATNQPAEAEPLMRRALAIDERAYEPDHPALARDLRNLALLLLATERPTEAGPPMARALAILLRFTAATGHRHPELEKLSGNYAAVLRAAGVDEPGISARLAALAGECGLPPDTLML